MADRPRDLVKPIKLAPRQKGSVSAKKTHGSKVFQLMRSEQCIRKEEGSSRDNDEKDGEGDCCWDIWGVVVGVGWRWSLGTVLTMMVMAMAMAAVVVAMAMSWKEEGG